jgi:phosphoglycerol transferase MdoB-like AlkP superfamily enzyme
MKAKILLIIKCFAAWLPLFAIQKPLFMLYNSAGKGYGCVDYINVILNGLKLDCTVAGYLTVIPLLLTLVSVWGAEKICKTILNGYFIVVATIVSAVFATDMALYEYWGFRLDSTLFFYLKSPKDAMASVPIGQFIAQFALFIVYGGFVYWILRKFILKGFNTGKEASSSIIGKLSSSIALAIMGGLMFIPIRGGVTTSTANVGMVYFSNDQFLNHSAINPCFSLIASLSKQQDFSKQFDFYQEDERERIFNSIRKTECDSVPKLLNTERPNVLVILLESFSANVIEPLGGEKGVTPCLNAIAKEGILFTNVYANSFRTDRGTVAALNGYLAQPTTSIMKYPAKSQTLPSIALALDSVGYECDMLYGGDINFTNMRSYFFSSGYGKITSDKDFLLKNRMSKWGANDDVTFHHLYEDIKGRSTKRPWHTMFLTLSSHEPFEVPYNRLSDPYANSVAFTDSCLGDFITKMKELPVWKNTLIVLVADHGYRYPADIKDYEPRRFHIPLLWIGGAVKEPMVVDKIANQTDLAATLLSQLGLPHGKFIFSKDIFCPSSPEYAFFTYPNCFGWIDESGVSVMDNDSGATLLSEPAENEEQRLSKGKALLQTLYDDLGSR